MRYVKVFVEFEDPDLTMERMLTDALAMAKGLQTVVFFSARGVEMDVASDSCVRYWTKFWNEEIM